MSTSVGGQAHRGRAGERQGGLVAVGDGGVERRARRSRLRPRSTASASASTTATTTPKRCRRHAALRRPGAQHGQRVGEAERPDRDEDERGDPHLAARDRVDLERLGHRQRRQQDPQEALVGRLAAPAGGIAATQASTIGRRSGLPVEGLSANGAMRATANQIVRRRRAARSSPGQIAGGPGSVARSAGARGRPRQRPRRSPSRPPRRGQRESVDVDVADPQRLGDHAVVDVATGEEPVSRIATRIATTATAKPTAAPSSQRPSALVAALGPEPARPATITAAIASTSSATRSRTQPRLRSRSGRRRASPGRPRRPASASSAGERSGSTVSTAARTTAATAKAPRLSLVRASAASSAPARGARQAARRARAEDREQGEGAEQRARRGPAGASARWRARRAAPKAAIIPATPSARRPVSRWRGEPEEEAGRDPEDDDDRAAGVGGDRLAGEREEAAEELVVEGAVGRVDVAVEDFAVGERLHRHQQRALVVVVGETG